MRRERGPEKDGYGRSKADQDLTPLPAFSLQLMEVILKTSNKVMPHFQELRIKNKNKNVLGGSINNGIG